MESVPVYQTLAVAVLAGFVAFATTPVAGKLSLLLGMLDRPSGRKLHASVVPYLGGLGILAGWMVVFLRPDNARESMGLLVGMVVLTITGFLDDRYDISAHLRLGIQISVAGGMIVSGVHLTVFEKLEIPGALVADPLMTMVWIVGMTNAFNFMDNMDGAAAGVGAIAAASFGVLGLIFGQQLVSVLGFALAGACLGFLRHNFHPARIFMGDTGSLPLGFCLAVLAIKVQFPGVDPIVAACVPLVVLGLFIVDSCVMAAGRLLRKEPLIGARLDHVTHRLLQSRIPIRTVALRLYLVAGVCGLTAVLMSIALPLIGSLIGLVAIGAAGRAVVSLLEMPILVVPPINDLQTVT